MHLEQIRNCRDLRPLKPAPAEVPHVVIEPNYTCNLRCARCYNQERTLVKTLGDVQTEIDLALRKRRLETVSILGGEPTLHPSLPEIIRYVKRAGLICQVLTNGVRLLQDDSGALLDDLQRAGLDRIILHADCGQGRTAERTEHLIDTLFARFEAKGLLHSLSITLYAENSGSVPGLMRRYAGNRYYDGILVTLARDPTDTVRPEGAGKGVPQPMAGDKYAALKPGESLPGSIPRHLVPDPKSERRDLDLLAEHERIVADLKVEATAYVPSSLDDAFVSWVMYFYYYNAATGATFAMSPRLNRLFRRLYRLYTGKNLFGATLTPAWLPVSFLTSTLLEIVLDPRRLRQAVGVVKGSAGLRGLRFHYILMQDGPQYSPAHGRVQICYMCPDATVRNGRITPVCLADQINPLPGSVRSADPELAQTVYGHLQEV